MVELHFFLAWGFHFVKTIFQEHKRVLEKAYQDTKGPLSIAEECLLQREKRQGIDQVHDDVERTLTRVSLTFPWYLYILIHYNVLMANDFVNVPHSINAVGKPMILKALNRCTQLLIANVTWLLTNTQRSWTVFHVSWWLHKRTDGWMLPNVLSPWIRGR